MLNSSILTLLQYIHKYQYTYTYTVPPLSKQGSYRRTERRRREGEAACRSEWIEPAKLCIARPCASSWNSSLMKSGNENELSLLLRRVERRVWEKELRFSFSFSWLTHWKQRPHGKGGFLLSKSYIALTNFLILRHCGLRSICCDNLTSAPHWF